MTLSAFEYCRPNTLAEGLKLLKENAEKIRPLAGGTDLLNNMKVGLNPAEVVMDITGIEGLANIECSVNKPVQVGAGITIWDFVHRPEVKENLTALYHAGCGVGAIQHQQMGTVGGNICQDTRCWFYNQTRHWRKARPLCYKTGGTQCLVIKNSERCHAALCSDLAPALIAFNAQVKIASMEGEREIALSDFYTGEGKNPTVLKAGEMVTQISIPESAWQTKSAYVKLRSRKSIDFPQAGAAVVLSEEGGVVQDANVVLVALGSGPVPVQGAGEIFKGIKIQELDGVKISALAQECAEKASKDILPVANTSWRPAYRRKMVAPIIEEALLKIRGN